MQYPGMLHTHPPTHNSHITHISHMNTCTLRTKAEVAQLPQTVPVRSCACSVPALCL